ncbi:hypothetical protein [Vulcanisaeta sp. JCM 14467]|uniref:hypothetical protein n=1 Tax=Vulcanisaeta sp. JCM 14467 TaxID=1295370 RepID=UPI000ABD3C3B|nr:hypothetical protein [Vulcanisaeta sp. JCM 14467]
MGILGYLGDDTWVCHLCEPNVKLRGKERAFEHVWHLHPQIRNIINNHNTDHA